MKWISIAGIREAEAVAFAQRNLPSYTAMCRAGAAIARAAQQIATAAQIQQFVILCGPGNNGGDGFIAARCLHEDGLSVRVCMTCVPARLTGDAARAWKDMDAIGLHAKVLPNGDAWLDSPWADPSVNPRKALIIDALLGIGASGAPREAIAAAIHWINGTNAACPVLSVDVPSGLDADSGTPLGEAVRANLTVTFSRPKLGFASPAARLYVGALSVVDIGLPADLLDAQTSTAPDGAELIADPEIRTYLRPERRLDSHKGNYGRALIIGGCAAYPHAPVLAALAAYRAGCGLVTLDVPDCSRAAAGTWVPEATFDIGAANDSAKPFQRLTAFDAVAIGTGMGAIAGARRDLLRHLASDPSAPRTVIDADALTALAQLRADGWMPDGSALRLILTPHPGEAARLLEQTVAEIQRDRPAAARAIASKYHAITVLKGHHTLVAEPGGRIHLCMGGNPGMATAGTGDILTGIIAGLLARGLGTEDAACLAVYHHALAGDATALIHGQESIIASDLFDSLRL
ncbi:MAG: NAD(P)H-hydrate dehydratase [Kiritimatiellia bacterium]